MAKSNREYAIVLGGLALGILMAGIPLIPFSPQGRDASAASPLLTLRSENVSAFECRKGPDGHYDWTLAEPSAKAQPGGRSLRSAANATVPDFSPRGARATDRIRREAPSEQAAILRAEERAASQTQVCDAGQALGHHG
jgi:hypothetical protein